MSSINRCIARTSSLVLLLALCAGGWASAKPTVIFEGKTLPMTVASAAGGKSAISVRDPGLAELLRDLGAAMTWNPGDRYALFTTAEPQIVSFAVGDARYDVGPRSAQAAFAPYELNGSVYVPFDELMSALYVLPKRDGGTTIVLQPQLASFDVRGAGDGSTIVARAAVPLHPRTVSDTPAQLVYAFDGVGTTLVGSRAVRAPGIRSVAFVQSGSVRDPVTTVTIDLQPGTTHGRPGSDDDRAFTLAIGGGAAAAAAVADVEPTDAAVPGPTEAPTQTVQTATAGPAIAKVTAVEGHGGPNGFSVDVSVTGDATYDWHRLRAPDNRFWIDIHGARLVAPIPDAPGSGVVAGMRVHQDDPDDVRIAFDLAGQQRLDVQPNANGLHVAIYDDEGGADVARSGQGTIGTAAAVAVAPTPAPSATPWKFGARPSGPVARNPRLIVIDPGHGGSDPGAGRGGVLEKNLTLDMAKRLRDILIARGWEVSLTRTTDVDVYKPDDSAHDELQARDDVANGAGARLLVSIHVNSFINAGPSGTTTYYSKPMDVPLAQAVQAEAAATLGTRSDGIVKSHLYITLHAQMPAILVETAFLSNPDDLAKLTSEAWRQKLALAIADGIKDYAGAPPATGAAPNQ